MIMELQQKVKNLEKENQQLKEELNENLVKNETYK